MNSTEIRNILRSPYNRDDWKNLYRNIFQNKVTFHEEPYEYNVNEDIVDSLFQIGYATLDDEYIVALFEVNVKNDVNILSKKIGLKKIISKYISDDKFNGVLTIFENGSPDYRFTFASKTTKITEDGIEVVETESKRFTYVLGINEPCLTPSQRFESLFKKNGNINLNDIKDAFSVEKLNKEFFNGYKDHYELLCKYFYSNPLRKIAFNNDDKLIRDFVKKFLGRIVFLYFVQKKGWLGVKEHNDWGTGDHLFLSNLFKEYKYKNQFYNKVLSKIFFECLSVERAVDLINLFDDKLYRIPYLNGGLFEKDEIDFNEIEINETYLESLFGFFDRFNFTIYEDDPNEHTVAVDPEMLGHIFENLLEDNKDKGAFYTPKEIVHYMCNESLIDYIFNNVINMSRSEVESIFNNKDISNVPDHILKSINELLDNVKICDPAIGSGAFPMALLQEIYSIKYIIHERLKLKWSGAQIKLNIIQNSIYGVDIESGAVDIARLRFWLSLIIDEQNPKSLPNLDYKIMQGNSLYESFEGIDLSNLGKFKNSNQNFNLDIFGNILNPQLNITDNSILENSEISNLLNSFFNETSPITKSILKDKINSIVHKHIEHNLNYLEKDLKKKIDLAPSLNSELKKTTRLKIEKIVKTLESFKSKREKLHLIQDKKNKPYFLWNLFFSDVINNGGFDIVIGNPPYIQLQSMNISSDDSYIKSYVTFDGNGDIYCLFYEKGVTILKKGGVLCYISSNKWMRTGYGEKLRKFFINHNPIKLIDFGGNQIFESASVDTNILLIRNEDNRNNLLALSVPKDLTYKNIVNIESKLKNFISFKNLNSEPWSINNLEETDLKYKIKNKGIPLFKWEVQINRGVTTGCNEVFIINESLKNQITLNDKDSITYIHPVIRGVDMLNYKYNWSKYFVLFTRRGYEINTSENIKKYLESHIDRLMPKPTDWDDKFKWGGRKSGKYKWFEIQDETKYFPSFENDKVVWMNMNRQWKYAFVPKGFYVEASCNFISSNIYAKYLTCILSSNLHLWYFKQTGRMFDDGGFMCKVDTISNFSVPIPTEKQKINFEILLDQLINYNDNDKYIEILNIMVCKIYDLTYFEYKLINENTVIDEKAYNNYLID
jgi:adenine-specific DNA-methyltransferase